MSKATLNKIRIVVLDFVKSGMFMYKDEYENDHRLYKCLKGCYDYINKKRPYSDLELHLRICEKVRCKISNDNTEGVCSIDTPALHMTWAVLYALETTYYTFELGHVARAIDYTMDAFFQYNNIDLVCHEKKRMKFVKQKFNKLLKDLEHIDCPELKERLKVAMAYVATPYTCFPGV